MPAPDARWLTIAATLALSCTRPPTQTLAPPVEAPVPARPRVAVAPPTPAPTAPAVTPHPGELTRLHIGEGWGCVVAASGELWCWGHGSVAASPWQAIRVDTPGPVVALGSATSSGSPADTVTCATFKGADAMCWQYAARGHTERWGPFAGTTGGLAIAVHAKSEGTGTNFVCVRMPDDSAPCYLAFTADAPERTLRQIVDLEHAGRMLALTRDGRILDLLAPVGHYDQVELRPAQIATIRGAQALVAAPFAAPICVLDERSALRCVREGRATSTTPVTALRTVPGPVRSIGLADEHGCVVTKEGRVVCAGRNRWGELGSGEPFSEQRHAAAEIPGVDAVREVAVTNEQTCVMTATSVRCYGRNSAVDVSAHESTLDLDARRIMIRGGRTCVVDGHESTWCWGEGVDGVGPRQVHLPIGAPVAIAGATAECFVDERRSIVCGPLIADPTDPGDLRLADGSRPRTIAVVGRGGDYAEPIRGALRLRDTAFKDPILGDPVTDLSSSGEQVCGLSGAGAVRCWARHGSPHGVSIEPFVPAITDAIAISGPCALRRSGDVSCWFGTSPVDAGLTGALRIVANHREVCALLPGRRIRCASLDPLAGLAPLDRYPTSNPITEDVVDLAAGVRHWCAVLVGGKVMCWGDNQYGELGTLPAGVSREGREITWGGAT